MKPQGQIGDHDTAGNDVQAPKRQDFCYTGETEDGMREANQTSPHSAEGTQGGHLYNIFTVFTDSSSLAPLFPLGVLFSAE